MSKNFKRLIGVLMVAAMISAMAVACSGKDEAAGADDSKTETVTEEDEKDDQQEDANRPPDDEDTSNDQGAEPKTENDQLTPEDVEALKASIRNSVTTRYLEPNGMTADQIVWPEDWYDFDMLVVTCDSYLAINMEIELEEEKASTDIFMAVILGVLDWLDTQGEYTIGYFGNTMRTLEPRNTVIPEVVSVTE